MICQQLRVGYTPSRTVLPVYHFDKVHAVVFFWRKPLPSIFNTTGQLRQDSKEVAGFIWSRPLPSGAHHNKLTADCWLYNKHIHQNATIVHYSTTDLLAVDSYTTERKRCSSAAPRPAAMNKTLTASRSRLFPRPVGSVSFCIGFSWMQLDPLNNSTFYNNYQILQKGKDHW